MLDKLLDIETKLPALLRDQTVKWRSVLVDYHPPVVERLWLDIDDLRLYLHRIHSCSREEALFHPHPWPSAMRIVDGQYEMGVGYSSTASPPESPLTTLLVVPGTAYAMTDPNSWHYVCPVTATSLSVMITGKPWGRSSPKPGKPLQELSESMKQALIEDFARHYTP